jgi:hypothetical protein
MMTIRAKALPVVILMTGIGASSLAAQAVTPGTGLEVGDPSRLGVHLIPGHGIDRYALKAIVEREFALGGRCCSGLSGGFHEGERKILLPARRPGHGVPLTSRCMCHTL